jgi:thymidine kinase
MSLHLVVGPMFAGKTSHIQSVVRRYACLKKKVLVITANIDNRYQQNVVSIINHDGGAEAARAVDISSLQTVFDWPEFADASAVILDEAQFFHGLREFVVGCLTANKYVVVVGLDGDAEGRPFSHVLDLVALADTVEKKSALCRECGDGTPAIFTKSLVQRVGRVAVGGADMYEPVCRRHFG